VSIGPRGAARVAFLLLTAAIGRAAAQPIDRVEVTLVGGAPPCSPSLRDVVAEQLADLTPDLVWACRERIDPEDAFRSDGAGAGAIRIAIELRAGTEARLTLGDTRSDRFVVRRVPLRSGLDEVGREQIGQIVRFSTLALRSGSNLTLSRTEARAAVASWAAPPARETSPPPADRTPREPRLAVDVGPIWSVSAFSREIPVVQELAIGATVRGTASHLWGWVEAGYRLPASEEAEPVGVELSAASLRLGLTVGQMGTRPLSFGGGAGIGLDRVRFTPIGAAASVQPAAPDAFWSASARLMFGGEWRPTARLSIGARLACDIAASDVHYDLRGSDGSARRVVTAFRIAPGLGIGVAWRL
jgi:hypothetical protein